MKEIQRFKKANFLIGLILGIIALAFLIWFAVELFTNESFNISCIISLSCLVGCIPLSLIYGFFSAKHRHYLINKYCGVVSEQDIQFSKELIEKIQCLRMGNYQFLDEEYYESHIRSIASLKSDLYEVSKGYKINEQLVKVYFDIREQIESSPYKDNPSNAEFNEFIRDLCELFERNKCDF